MLQSISSYSFQAMAHLDFPRRYFDSWEIPEKTINSILELMIKKEILLEINTSSISNDCTEPLPSYNIIKKYIELGGKKVVLGSDCILRSPADSDAFQSGRYAEHNGRSKTLDFIV